MILADGELFIFLKLKHTLALSIIFP